MSATQEDIYALGYSSYTAGNFAQAVQLFTTLVLKNPFEGKFWRGLASAQQMETKYREALQAWALVAMLDDADPLPHFHAAECLTSLNERADAAKALDMAEKRLKVGSENLRQKIQLLRGLNGG